MNHLSLALAVLIFGVSPALARRANNDRILQDREIQQQRMEEDISATVGGAGSGMVKSQKQEEIQKARHEEDKQKMLYQHDGKFRKGF
jgi:hypothetical protein